MTIADIKTDDRPLIAHVVFSFDYGGLENGLVNVINGLPEKDFRHAIIAFTEASGFKSRIAKSDVVVHALNKRPGKDPTAYLRLFRLLRQLRPAVVHTRNLGTLEGAVVARLAGVPYRIHGEHGWDVYDPDGSSRKYRALRRLVSPAVHRFVAVSSELEDWLAATVGIEPAKITRICNGVDTEKFRPGIPGERQVLPPDRFPPGTLVVGSVTRFSTIKDPLNLVRAFIEARRTPDGDALRLAVIGDGALRADAERLLLEAGLARDAWLPGSRDDVAQVLREMDVFVLGSLREGISNTLLEAMATGLPTIATSTGGNLELVHEGTSGTFVAPGSSSALAQAMLQYARDRSLRVAHGQAARRRIEEGYSLQRMLTQYEALYRAYYSDRLEAA
jgi:sugar transferase (PEP-CTERM/EpsH1 system associated)